MDDAEMECDRLLLQQQAFEAFEDTTELNNDSIQTEYHLKRNQTFTKFNINLPSQVKQIILTVVQKEFKAFLTACQLLDEEIQMYLTVGGAPLLLTNDENSSKGYASFKLKIAIKIPSKIEAFLTDINCILFR